MTTEASQNNSHNASHGDLMDNIYRYTRHVYDFTRKYYLLGRDKLIAGLNVKTGDHIIEIGCGTARNLVKMAEANPHAVFMGLDASEEMLKTAQKNLERACQEYCIPIKKGFAQNYDSKALFGMKKFQRIVFSYSLSMIPPWKESIDHALACLAKGGEIHIVDFGQQEELPEWFKKFLFRFRKLFHVVPEPELETYLLSLNDKSGLNIEISKPFKGYALLAVIRKA